MRQETYIPGLATGALRPATASDVRSVLQEYLSHGESPPAAITVALPLLDLTRAPIGYRARYKAASQGFEDLARELLAQGIELKGSPGCLGWEIRILPRGDGHGPHQDDDHGLHQDDDHGLHQGEIPRVEETLGADGKVRPKQLVKITSSIEEPPVPGTARGAPPRCAARGPARRSGPCRGDCFEEAVVFLTPGLPAVF